jgi:hypothetical protein
VRSSTRAALEFFAAMPRTAVAALALSVFALMACGCTAPPRDAAAAVGALADRYVKLVLAMGEHDPDYVDAYFGPDDWRASATRDYPTLDAIETQARASLAALAAIGDIAEPLEARRRAALGKRLIALEARVGMLQGRRLTFDEETRLVYDAVAPDYDDEHFAAVIAELDRLLPGEGGLAERSAALRQRFVIPPERLAAVFDAAIAECRRRTLEHIALPAGERLTVEYVTGKPWSGYNWYQGDTVSVVQINTDLPVYIDRAIDLGCHEGYPGHHTQNALLETELYRGRGWSEYSIYALFSPQSPIAEGSANFGIELAFPAEERARFEDETLMPLAGLESGDAAIYRRYLVLRQRLSYARNEAARDYLDGRRSREATLEWLERYALMTPAEAAQNLGFIDTYRSYVINYNLGEDVVRAYVERRAGDDVERRWQVFAELIAAPVSMSDLQ